MIIIKPGLFAETSHCKVEQGEFSGPADDVLAYVCMAPLSCRVREVPISSLKVANMETPCYCTVVITITGKNPE